MKRLGWILLCLCLIASAYVLGRCAVSTTDAPIVPYPLMDEGGRESLAGQVTGCISIVRSAQSYCRSEWFLVVENWPISEKYTVGFLHYDRTDANHEKVKWNIADFTFLVVDDDNAVLFYTLDDKEYFAWSTSHTVATCYGGTDKWWFGQ